MTRERAKQLLPIIQAYADGKTIQSKGINRNYWADVQYPSFDGIGGYRIKPKPREFWVKVLNERDNSFIASFGWIHDGDEIPKETNADSEIIKVREVINES